MKTFVLKGYEVRERGSAGQWRFVCAVAAADLESAAKKLCGEVRPSGGSLYFNGSRRTPAVVAKAIVAREGLRGKQRRQAFKQASSKVSSYSSFILDPAPVVR